MNTQELPKHIGGYQHLAPDVVVQEGDICVLDGVPDCFCRATIGTKVYDAEEACGMNIYRLIPVARQGDCDTTGWKTVAACHDQKPGVIVARALGCNVLPTDPKARKGIPIYSGFLKYFPLAVAYVAQVSKMGNDQHNPGKPLHWDRSKSGDELDAASRHLLEAGGFDSDGARHSGKNAWRSMAALQKELEAADAAGEPWFLEKKEE